MENTVLVIVPPQSAHEYVVHTKEDWMTNDDVEEDCMDVNAMNIGQPEESGMNIVVRSRRRKRLVEDDTFDWSAKRWNIAAR